MRLTETLNFLQNYEMTSKKTAVAAISATAAAGILGPTTAATCVMMVVAAGGVDVLNKLREYRIEEQGDRLFLVK